MTTIQAPPASGTYPAITVQVWRKREVESQATPHVEPASELASQRTYASHRPDRSKSETNSTEAATRDAQSRTLQATLQETDLSRALQALRTLKEGHHGAVPSVPRTPDSAPAPEADAPAPATATRTVSADPYSRVSEDLEALKSALQAGDLSGAQRAFATFQHDLHNVNHAQALMNVQVTVSAPAPEIPATPTRAHAESAAEVPGSELDLLA